VKLCDFGFAKVDDGKMCTPSFSPYYVAPQVRNLLSSVQCVGPSHGKHCLWRFPHKVR